MWSQSLGREDPLEEGMATHSSIFVWRIPMDRGAWWATVHGVAKCWTRLKQLSMREVLGLARDLAPRTSSVAVALLF